MDKRLKSGSDFDCPFILLGASWATAAPSSANVRTQSNKSNPT